MAAPAISVVIPAGRREARLRFCLEALRGQSLDPDRFEVIVVRSSQADASPVAPEGLNARFLQSQTEGAAAQRNLGWRQAAAALVAFTGDDCRPEAGWLAQLVTSAEVSGPDAIVQGATEPDADEVHLLYGVARTVRVDGPDRWFRACNIAYPREMLERAGGFDESFASDCGDADLGLRCEQQGARLVFAPGALVSHAVEVGPLAESIARAISAAEEPALIARHRDQREQLELGPFSSKRHAKLLLALAGALLWRRSRTLAALAAYPYVADLVVRRLRNPNPLSPIGAFRIASDLLAGAALDGIEIGAKLRASVKHRELVL